MDNAEMLLISIIIPVYNVERYLPDCLDSLLAQTYPDFELICVNDGSPDNSQAILEQYAQKDSRIRVFQKENGGVSSARNFGLEQAKGEYIGFVDPDDMVLPEYLEWLLSAIKERSVPMAVCDAQMISKQETPDRSGTAAKIIEVQLSEATYRGQTIKRYCWGALYSRALVQDLQFDTSLFIGEDTLFFLEAFLKAGRYALLKNRLYLYIQRDNSAYRCLYNPKRFTEFLAMKKVAEKTVSVPGVLHDSAVYELLMTSQKIYYRMLDSNYRDPQKEKELVEEMCRYKKRIHEIRPSAGWELWAKAKLLSMLYVPAGVNRAVWGRLEWLRAKKNKHKK